MPSLEVIMVRMLAGGYIQRLRGFRLSPSLPTRHFFIHTVLVKKSINKELKSKSVCFSMSNRNVDADGREDMRRIEDVEMRVWKKMNKILL